MQNITPGELVLVTGGTGSLGYALVPRLLDAGARVRVMARDEKKQYDMRKQFPECEYVIGDVRDVNSLRAAVRDVDVVIHGASLKYVNISELQPSEYVMTNVSGTLNLVNAVLEEGKARVCLGISTDKACQPLNTYGMTKALLEKIFLEANYRQGEHRVTEFVVARYGNVVGTRGSVIPFWKELVEAGEPLPITNPEMTRFFFTLEDAVALIDYSLSVPAGWIVSKKMKSCTLEALADAIRGDLPTKVVGERPGEKHHELLISEDEMLHTWEQDGYLIYVPDSPPTRRTGLPYYGSQNAERMTAEEIKKLVC